MEKSKTSEKIRQFFYEPAVEGPPGLYISWCGYRKCNANHEIGPRVLSTYKIVFVVSGKGIVEQEGFPVLYVGAGDVFVLYAGKKHHYFADPQDPWELMWVAFNGSSAQCILRSTNIVDNPHFPKCKVSAAVKSLLQNIMDAMSDICDECKLQATGYLLLLFHKLSYHTDSTQHSARRENIDSIVNKATRFIEENYYNDLDVNVLSSYVNYSRSYLSRNFRSIVGMSIPAYINKVRIETAKTLLCDTSLNIMEIANSVGIKDQFYFSKLFRSIMQLSPSEYRAKYADMPLVLFAGKQ